MQPKPKLIISGILAIVGTALIFAVKQTEIYSMLIPAGLFILFALCLFIEGIAELWQKAIQSTD